MRAPVTKPDGTQAIRRAAAILRRLARGPRTGMNLREISEAMDLTRSTAHRMLKCLLDERLVDHVQGTRRYVIGGLTFELGLAATNHQVEVMKWRPAVEELSRQTEATIYLMGRSGNDAVCLFKCEGSAVVRVIPVEVGQRRPLGVGAGATALLAATGEADVERVLEAIAPGLDRYTSLTLEQIRRNAEAARRGGFAESRGTVAKGVYGLGAAVPNGHGPATLALSLAAHESLATAERIAAWKRCMTKALSAD
jgi:DNA-binding IclR family transcriptional regulator